MPGSTVRHQMEWGRGTRRDVSRGMPPGRQWDDALAAESHQGTGSAYALIERPKQGLVAGRSRQSALARQVQVRYSLGR
jgi:hypothetical protein